MASEVEKTLALDPDHPMGISMRGEWLAHSGRQMEAVPLVERLMRLDPALNPLHLGQLAKIYLLAERYETAVALLRERIRLVPETDTSRGYLVAALGHLGRLDDARAVWDELMRINPKYSIGERLGRVWFKDPAHRERLIDGVRKAGLPV
jgi:adenylate cyclase